VHSAVCSYWVTMATDDASTLHPNSGDRAGSGSPPASGAPSRRTFWAWLWSPDLTLWLIGILVVAMAIGTVIPQRESADAYRRLFGQFGGALLTRTSLINVYGSWWFIAVFGLLAVNLAACVIQRGSAVARAQRAAPQTLSAAQVRGQRASAELPSKLALDRTVERLSQALRHRGYRVESVEAAEKGATALRARRGGIRAWGAPVVHFGMLVVLLGAGYGRLPGHSFDRTMSIGSGDWGRVNLGDRSFDLRLRAAGAEQDKQGAVTGYWAKIQIIQDPRTIRDVTISPNHPLRYRGVNAVLDRVPSYAVAVTKGGAPVYLPVTLNGQRVPMMSTVQRLADPPWMVWVYDFRMPSAASGAGEAGPAALVRIDESGTVSRNKRELGWVGAEGLDYKGVHFQLVEEPAQLGLHHDSGLPVVWAGFAIVVLGCLLALLVTRRDVLAMVTPRAGGATVLLGASARGFGPGGESVIDSLGREVTAREEGKP
jgi:cytochrome c biogenesis protein